MQSRSRHLRILPDVHGSRCAAACVHVFRQMIDAVDAESTAGIVREHYWNFITAYQLKREVSVCDGHFWLVNDRGARVFVAPLKDGSPSRWLTDEEFDRLLPKRDPGAPIYCMACIGSIIRRGEATACAHCRARVRWQT